MKRPIISVIVPVYNECQHIDDCLFSLVSQEDMDIEIIVVDDGSTDGTLEKIKDIQQHHQDIILIHQSHLGPAVARNAAAKQAKGDMLVFFDADMTCDRRYISALVAPIIEGKSKGTFTKEEYVSNWENVWARCWNHMQGISDKRRIPSAYPITSPVFRAIKKSEFDRVGGFDPIGYTDDWTLSRKLGYKATVAPGAICYHKNPETLSEVFSQARWIGKNEFISGSIVRRVYNLGKYFPVYQSLLGVWDAVKYKTLTMILFRSVYASGIWISLISRVLRFSYY